jgi:hypothetical protein
MPMGENTTNFSSGNTENTESNVSIDELISSYIDKELKQPESVKYVEQQIASDSNLSKKYQSELLTRNLFRDRLKMAEVPQKTFMTVTNSIDGLIKDAKLKYAENNVQHPIESSTSFLDYLSKVIVMPVRIGGASVPRYAFGIVAIVLFVGIGFLLTKTNNNFHGNNPYITSGADNSVMVQAVKYFHKVLTGEMTPQVKSNNAVEVKNYLNDKLNFQVYIPEIKNYTLVGALYGDCHQEKVAHLIYSSGDDIIYIYQVPSKCLKNKHLQLPEPVNNQMISDKYFMCDEVDANNCTMTLWYEQDLICASVSTIPKQKMSTTFASFK